MKYFVNINNAEELRKAYRQHVINMHPDRGGNEEEFKAMQAEFEQLKKQYQNGTRREQYAHTETAEERARRQAKDDPDGTRVIVETNEEDPTAPANEFGRYFMVDGSTENSCADYAGQWVVIRVDTVTSPYEVHRPNWCSAQGYADSSKQLCCRSSHPANVTRWAYAMINAGRVLDIYNDGY